MIGLMQVMVHRLTLSGIAMTEAFVRDGLLVAERPPHADWNRDD